MNEERDTSPESYSLPTDTAKLVEAAGTIASSATVDKPGGDTYKPHQSLPTYQSNQDPDNPKPHTMG